MFAHLGCSKQSADRTINEINQYDQGILLTALCSTPGLPNLFCDVTDEGGGDCQTPLRFLWPQTSNFHTNRIGETLAAHRVKNLRVE
jgi:hypothetical protein